MNELTEVEKSRISKGNYSASCFARLSDFLVRQALELAGYQLMETYENGTGLFVIPAYSWN